MVLLLLAVVVRAEGPDDDYVRIYSLIQEADRINDSNQGRQAMAKYAEAQAALARFANVYPGWNEKVVIYRLNYVAGKLTPLVAQFGTNLIVTPPAPVALPPVATETTSANKTINEAYALVRELQEETRRLQTDKATLSAKLKEALSAQPATVDPRELAKSEQKNKSLQKENELLKVTLNQEQKKSSTTVDPARLTEANRALGEAWNKLEQHTRTLHALEARNETLTKQLASLEKKNTGEAQELSQPLRKARESLASVQSLNDTLRKDKSALEARVVELMIKQSGRELELERQLKIAKSSAKSGEQLVAKLQKEKADLETRLAMLPVGGADGSKSDSKKVKQLKEALEKQLAATKENQRLVASLQREKNDLQASLNAATADAAKADAKKRKQLEDEIADLRGKLAKADKELSQRSGTKAVPSEAQKELAILRARLQVLESKAIPYTADELAALRGPAVQLAVSTSGAKSATYASVAKETPGAAVPVATKKLIKEPPTGAGALAASAQRAFLARRFDEAEKKYVEILRQDERNVFTLGNTAAIQIEMNKLDEAEKNLVTALGVDPQDDFCLYLLGRVKFLRGKMDEALNLLSQAAKANPEGAETQNYLGIVLSEKGMRAQAETAFRKAIQLQPGYAAAHNNLAFIYATQKPPTLALARWHYEKALASGQPKNPDLEKLLGGKK